MKIGSPDFKHFILTMYQRQTRGSGFDALAAQYNIPGGGKTVQRWYEAWDGTPESLKRKPGQGRPRKLSEAEVRRYVLTPVRKRNREGIPIQYREVLAPLQEQTGKRVSLRTVQRVGKENADINSKPITNKTKWECKNHMHTTLLD
jgi:transposase